MGKPGQLGRVSAEVPALCGLGVVLVLFGDGLGGLGVTLPFGGVGRRLAGPMLEVAAILTLAGGTVWSVRLAARGSGGRLRFFAGVWAGVALTWAVLGGLTAVASYALAGADDLRQLLVAIGGGALNGTRHGALLGWVVALPGIYRRRPAVSELPEPTHPPGPSQPHGPPAAQAPAAQAPARAGAPYLILTVLVWLPLVVLGVGGRLFASDVTPSNCVSLCFSDRDGTFFLALFASFVAVPMWALQLFALRVLRNTRFGSWPVAGQVVTVLAGGLAVVAAFGAYWLNR